MRKYFFSIQFSEDQEVEKQNVLLRAGGNRHSDTLLVRVERRTTFIESNLIIVI